METQIPLHQPVSKSYVESHTVADTFVPVLSTLERYTLDAPSIVISQVQAQEQYSNGFSTEYMAGAGYQQAGPMYTLPKACASSSAQARSFATASYAVNLGAVPSTATVLGPHLDLHLWGVPVPLSRIAYTLTTLLAVLRASWNDEQQALPFAEASYFVMIATLERGTAMRLTASLDDVFEVLHVWSLRFSLISLSFSCIF
ncbi:hypothetical protein R3P38DRAFT_3291157 [Favolaschia claudopus]|uniref:Uncharacterized protein n=1 Tax=Favolaschia claudopus TaxID=2862362 RepID=A0AAV9ZPX4_9AGAR